MGNNIDVAVRVDTADLQVKRAIMSAELKTASKDLNDFAKTAARSGMTDELRTSMLAAGNEVAGLKKQISLTDVEIRKATASQLEETGAVVASTGAHVSNRAAREALVLVHELMSGNYHRMAGSLMIEAQALAGAERSTSAFAAVFSPLGLAVGATIGSLVALAVAAEKGSEENAKFTNAMTATNGAAGITISRMQEMARTISGQTSASIGTATAEMQKLVATGKFTGDTLRLIGEDSIRMAALTGESADKFNDEFGKMTGGVSKFALEYQRQYHQLTTAQVEYIHQLEEQGRKEEAERQLAQDVFDYLGQQAPEQLGYLESAWHSLGRTVSQVWEDMKAVGRNSLDDQVNALQQRITQLKGGSSRYAAGNAGEIAATEKEIAALNARMQAEDRAASAKAQRTRDQDAGIEAASRLKDKFEDSRTSGEKLRHVIQGINQDLAAAIKADPGHKELFEQEAAAARSQAQKSDAPHVAKHHGPSAAQEWAEELHQQEVLSNDFFSDQTTNELKFWQSKLGLTKQGSKEWLEVQSHIYEAQKTLAHQDYSDHLATINDKLQADRDNWSKEQADWQEKLDFIKSKHGAESAEYKNAHREFEAAEREHQRTMAEIEKQAAQEVLSSLKAQLQAEQQIRAENNRTAELQISSRSGGSSNPLAGVNATIEMANLHRQEILQQMADEQAYYDKQGQLLQQSVSQARAAYGQESTQYQKAVNDKAAADRDFAQKHRLLSTQLVNQEKQDALKVRQAWHSAIDPLVSSWGSAVKGLVTGTETWKQALMSVANTLLDVVINAIEKMIENWIVNLIVGKAIQGTTSGAQVISNAAVAASGAYAATAAIPVVGPELAPAAAATALAGAMAYLPLTQFAVGTNYVPNDMIAQIHAGERIIPAADNRALMAALNDNSWAQGGGSNRSSAGSTDDGGEDHYHLHLHGNIIHSPKDLERYFKQNRSAVGAGIKQYARMGGR